ncbi:MAG: TraB/GumN family protein [Cyanobacteria bacterium]|nr:TraB/GumN family protein [Cyanobacteriota bacterium]
MRLKLMVLAGCVGLGLMQTAYAAPKKAASEFELEAERQREKAWARSTAEVEARKLLLDSQKRSFKPAYLQRLKQQLQVQIGDLNKAKTKKGWPYRLELDKGSSEFMWRVRNEKAVIFLVGTVPLVLPDFYPLPREVYQAMSNCDAVLLDMPSAKAPSGNLTGGDSLSKHLSKETLSLYLNYLVEKNQSRDFFEKKKPWMVAKMLETAELQRLGMRSESGLEKHFYRKGQQAGKKFLVLNAADAEQNILNSLPPKDQEQYLHLVLLELRGKENQTDRLADCWWKGDPKSMEKTLTAFSHSRPELAEVQKTIVEKKTEALLTQLEGLLEQGGSYFVVVDSANLVGENGLVNAFKNKDGLEISQVSAGTSVSAEPRVASKPRLVADATPPGTVSDAQKTAVETKSAAAAPAKAPETPKEYAHIKDAPTLMKQVETLVKKFYPRATLKVTGERIEFQFKTQKFQSNGLLVDAPKLDGILGEVAITSGQYSGPEMLPSLTNELLYTTLVMAPYSESQNSHLHARLVYPPNAPSDFINQFKSLINCYQRI